MKVLDLQCANAHTFEGWFASEGDYLAQQAKAMLACPLCGDTQVEKKLSAPRLNLGATAQPTLPKPTAEGTAAGASSAPSHGLNAAQMQAAYTHIVRELVRQTEDVGPRFAQEARAIHDGEAPERGIRGQATPQEAQALADDGIAVMTLPIPEFAKQTLQ